jgi:transcription antitermination factor NusG
VTFAGTEPNWFALQVRTRTEHQVSEILRSKGYEEFLPVSSSRKKRATYDTPLFPGYVFCRIMPTSQGRIVTTPGVIRIVSFGGKPAVVDPEEIRSIQLVVSSGVPVFASRSLQIGDLVRIEEGPLRGAVGRLISVRARQRLAVSITMMMRTIIAEVEPEWLTSISPARPTVSPAAYGVGEPFAGRSMTYCSAVDAF